MAPQVVIDATKSLLQCEVHAEMSCALEHLVESCKVLEPARSLNLQDWILEPLLVDDAEDPAANDEDLGYGVEALVDDGESLDGLKKH